MCHKNMKTYENKLKLGKLVKNCENNYKIHKKKVYVK